MGTWKKTQPDSGEQLTLAGFPAEEHADSGRIAALSRGMKRHATRQESRLYRHLFLAMGIPVQRQAVIDHYIVDFFIPPCTVVELDGSQHYSDSGRSADSRRDARLQELGFRVLRYSNNDVMQHFEAVCTDILNKI